MRNASQKGSVGPGELLPEMFLYYKNTKTFLFSKIIRKNMERKERVIAYIDGFNLYFGIISAFKNVRWLNIELLVKNLLKPHQELVAVKYFTSLVSNNPPKEKRQRDFISALQTTSVKIIYGHYKSKIKNCQRCGYSWNANEEKMTDVNISIEMIVDAMENKFDTALLVSGDSDLVPPINIIHEKFDHKRVLVIFPPNRHNNSVKNAAKGSMILGKQKLLQSQFPETITLPSGFVLKKPGNW